MRGREDAKVRRKAKKHQGKAIAATCKWHAMDNKDVCMCPNQASATYNLLALLNTRLDFRNVARRIVISKLLNLVLAHNGQILFCR